MATDNPINVDISAKINADFTPLITAAPKGIGRIISYIFSGREAKNLRNTILMAAKTQVEFEMILSGKYSYENGKIVPSPYFALREDANPFDIERRKELHNLSGNVMMAVESLKDISDEEISDKSIDDDFFERWRREAKVIGREDIQRLWGRLLAEEIKEPGTISLRVLDVLKNISSAEAKLFQKMAPYCCDAGVIICDFDKALPSDFTFDDYLLLSESGLAVYTDPSVCGFSTELISICKKEHVKIALSDKIIAVDIDKKEVSIPGMILSSAGKVALHICDYDNPDINIVKYCCAAISSRMDNPLNRIICYAKREINNYDNETPLFDSQALIVE